MLLLALAPPPAARAQEELEDVFGELGTAATVEEGEADAAAPGEGTIAGRVFDGDTGLPIPGVTVIAIFPEPPGGGERPQEVAVTGADGGYEFPSVPPGTYDLSFVKAGYRAATMTRFEVLADQVNTGDFPMPPLPPGTSDEVLELDPFVAEASAVGEMMSDLELRMDADQMLNVMSAEELARFAAGDVAEALKRVAGVNVVEGKFAIIRGLEDRYSSTLYNAAPIPSPDPDRQSPQLDLFPSEVVSNLVVSKTFASEHPGNSSSGSIDIVTHDYPEAPLDLKVKSGTGFNDNAADEYLEYRDGSPIGTRKDAASSWPDDTLESEFGGSLGGRQRFFGREFRFKGVLNREIDYVTKDGFKNNREPRPTEFRRDDVTVAGGLSLGKLDLMGGRFDLTESSREEQNTGFGAVGFDLDPDGNHAIDASFFYTDNKQETVELQSNGYFPNFDYSTLRELEIEGEEIRSALFNDFATTTTWIRNVRTDPNLGADRGPLWFTSLFESKSFQSKRDLKVWQANGRHRIALLDGLQLSWAANHAKTTQKDLALGARYFFEPTSERLGEILADPENELPTAFPVQPQDLGAGRFATNGGILRSANDIDENQDFGRVDARYEREVLEWLSLEVHGGGWYENSNRDVESSFLESTSVGSQSQFAIFGDDPEQLGDVLFETLDEGEDGRPRPTRDMLNDSKREITAWSFGGKATLWDKLDLLGGLRTEKIEISSNNDAFTGDDRFGAPDTYPTRYLFFDRRDNPTRAGEVKRPRPPGTTFNDELLGIDVPIDTSTTACDPPGESRGCVDL
ncbi:MAG: carboxypeptidase regulatory-like domain-containing protein, partial [Myxococcota bacterium]|nr:carboxypeptidase regulatory-like domain-containing protein [Myxococcota bacterium]